MGLTIFLKKLRNKLQETMLRTGIVGTNLTGHFLLIFDKFQLCLERFLLAAKHQTTRVVSKYNGTIIIVVNVIVTNRY